MSYQASTWASKCRTGDSTLKGLLLALANYANEDGECWHSQKRIAFDTEIPERTLRRKMQALVDMGFIQITHRTYDDGKKRTSLIRLISTPATVADGASTGQKEALPSAKTGGEPSATWLAGEEATKNSKELSSIVGKAPKKKTLEYTAEFESELWQPYPRKQGTSKLNAFKKWLALSPADQALVKAALPTYCRLMAGKDHVHHLEFFISRRIFETVAVPDGAAAPVGPVQIDRQSWENTARIFANNSNWPRDLGPEPGRPGCRMPADLQQQFIHQGASH